MRPKIVVAAVLLCVITYAANIGAHLYATSHGALRPPPPPRHTDPPVATSPTPARQSLGARPVAAIPTRAADPTSAGLAALDRLASLRCGFHDRVDFPAYPEYRRWAEGKLGHAVLPNPSNTAPSKGKKAKDRSSSYPFVTGDGFREMSDCICDEVSCGGWGVTPDRCRVFFVKTERLDFFIEEVLPRAGRRGPGDRFVLITHNSDYTSPWSQGNVRGKNGLSAEYPHQQKHILDNPSVARWFAQNPAILHPKLTPIPIGLENRYNPYGRFVKIYRELHDSSRGDLSGGGGGGGGATGNPPLIFANFNPKTNPKSRGAAISRLAVLEGDHPGSVTRDIQGGKKKGPPRTPPPPSSGGAAEGAPMAPKEASLHSYGRRAGQHRFCMAPPGHGLDTHRLWETLVFGCIPLVVSSPLDPLLRGMPVVVLPSWDSLDIPALQWRYEDLMAAESRFDMAKLYLPYWVQQVADALREA